MFDILKSITEYLKIFYSSKNLQLFLTSLSEGINLKAIKYYIS